MLRYKPVCFLIPDVIVRLQERLGRKDQQPPVAEPEIVGALPVVSRLLDPPFEQRPDVLPVVQIVGTIQQDHATHASGAGTRAPYTSARPRAKRRGHGNPVASSPTGGPAITGLHGSFVHSINSSSLVARHCTCGCTPVIDQRGDPVVVHRAPAPGAVLVRSTRCRRKRDGQMRPVDQIPADWHGPSACCQSQLRWGYTGRTGDRPPSTGSTHSGRSSSSPEA